MLASPAYLYMSHLFIQCLPTIICVMLMFFLFFVIFVICHISLLLHFGLFVYIFSLVLHSIVVVLIPNCQFLKFVT